LPPALQKDGAGSVNISLPSGFPGCGAVFDLKKSVELARRTGVLAAIVGATDSMSAQELEGYDAERAIFLCFQTDDNSLRRLMNRKGLTED
jgi:hypothetical protein